jgi:hypothetical protein
MLFLDLLAERKIAEAVSRGELDDLPGRGRPLDLEDDALVPEDLRLAYRILKNAGYVPPEVQELKEIAALENLLLEGGADDAAHAKATRRLALLRTRIEAAYYGKLVKRFSR